MKINDVTANYMKSADVYRDYMMKIDVEKKINDECSKIWEELKGIKEKIK